MSINFKRQQYASVQLKMEKKIILSSPEKQTKNIDESSCTQGRVQIVIQSNAL